MKFKDQIKMAFKSLRTRKRSSILTIIGVMIGIAAIVGIFSLSNGLQTTVEQQFTEQLNINVVSVGPKRSFGPLAELQKSPEAVDLFFIDAPVLNSFEYVQLAVPYISRTCIMEYNGENISVTVIGVDFDKYKQLFPTMFMAGQGEIPIDNNDTWVIGYNIYKDKDTIIKEVGDSLTISWNIKNTTQSINYTYTTDISGALEPIGGLSVWGLSDNAIYLPIGRALDLFDPQNVGNADSMLLLLENQSPDIISSVEQNLQIYYDSDTIGVQSMSSQIDAMLSILDTIFMFMIAIAAISLIVGGIGIMNVMYISVTERTKEIGILKSLGIEDKDVLKPFLYESVIIGLIGGIVGILFGYILAYGLGAILTSMMAGKGPMTIFAYGVQPVMDLQLLISALLFGVVVSIIFGLQPARRAAKMNPILALRNE